MGLERYVSLPLCPLLSLCFFLSLSPSSSPQMPSPLSQSLKGAEVEEAGAHCKRWRGLPALRRAATSGRNRSCFASQKPAPGLFPSSPGAFYGSSQAWLPLRTGFILGRTRPSAWQTTPRCKGLSPLHIEAWTVCFLRSWHSAPPVEAFAGAGDGRTSRFGASWRG